MLADPVRVDAYEAALRQVIDPTTTVLEIGTGTGFFAVLACKLGAARVHAIEPDDSIQVARELAAANGVADRITFHQDLSTRVTLPDPADVLFSDLRGILPLWEQHIETIRDARARLLKPAGTQIPLGDNVYVAPVAAPDLYRKQVRPWAGMERGLDMSAASRRLANVFTKARFQPGQLLAEPAVWARLDYATISDPNVAGRVGWELAGAAEPPAEARSEAHGLAAWFDAELVPGIGFSNAPQAPEALYGQVFFPFAQPLAWAEGDRLEVDLRAHRVGENYLWEWRTRLSPRAGGAPETRFAQSSLAGAVLSPETFRRGGHDYVPHLDEEGSIDVFILQAMDGTASVGDIARGLLERFPHRFPGEREARDRVSALSRARSR
jgi:protein arginine N-methyltransferase 1